MGNRVDVKKILKNPEQRRKLMVDAIIALQAREGITTTREQAEAAYDAVQRERRILVDGTVDLGPPKKPGEIGYISGWSQRQELTSAIEQYLLTSGTRVGQGRYRIVIERIGPAEGD